MAADEINPYQRNLKIVSGAFIIYWLLGLEIKTDPSSGSGNIALMFVQFSMQNPEALVIVSWTLLGYSFWRFSVTLEDNFWEHVKSSVKLNLGSDRKKSSRLDRKLRRLALSRRKTDEPWLVDAATPDSDVIMHISWAGTHDGRTFSQLYCCFKRDQTNNVRSEEVNVSLSLSFRMLPHYYLKNAIRVIFKEDVTHTTIVPVLLFLSAVVTGVLTLCGVRPF